MMRVSPNFGAPASATIATSLSRTLWPWLCDTTTSPRASVVTVWPFRLDEDALVGVLDKAGPDHAGGKPRAASDHVGEERPWARRRSGWTWIWNCRTSPPKTMHRATPGMESILGLITQSASVRSSIGVRLVESRPIFSRSMVAEVMGDITGRPDPGWQLARHFAQPLVEHVARDENVRAFMKNRHDDGQTGNGFGAQRGHVPQTVDGVFQGPGDQHFHLFGRETRRFGFHLHFRRDEIGQHIQLGVGGGVNAVAGQHTGERGHHAAKPQGKLNDPV